MNTINIGIDLGTTNSVLAFTNMKANGDIVSKVQEINRPVDMYSGAGNSPRLSTMKKNTLPSCVYYVQENNYQPIIGDFAKRQYPIRPHLVAKSIKSQMGKPEAEGLSPDIPDNTPAQISARILKHMIADTEKSLRTKITDAVITVPANFDSSMCQATREAACLAGIQIYNPDGSEKPILLSEPNAVIYDLFNQIRNGEIPDTVLDLSQSRKVIVFDLGGGTLDITMHEIKRRNNENDGTLKITEIATNRYTQLGGDDFDEAIADKMFERYKSHYPGQVNDILKHKDEIMPVMRRQAEDLKIEMSTSFVSSDDSQDEWWDDESNSFYQGFAIACTGYAYEDEFTREELEEILSEFMADELVFDDYKKIDRITNTRNIIFPILDVLSKASQKPDMSDLKIDAVIVNGGMSKFYMVTERLTKFFGFEPIVALDPDLSVARGAAVYHYLLTNANHNELADDMMKGNEKQPFAKKSVKPPVSDIGMELIRTTLNDALYLCTRNNTREVLIPTGAELPFDSEVKKYLLPTSNSSIYTSQIIFPIQSRNIDGTFRIISKSIVSFKSRYPAGTEVAVQVHMNSSKVITMKAWICQDNENIKKDLVQAEIIIENEKSMTPEQRKINRVVAPNGSKINIKEVIDSFIKNCENFERQRTSGKQKGIAIKIRMDADSICSACNRKDFAPVIIQTLKSCRSEEAKKRLFVIARKIMSDWTEKDKKEIAMICMNHLSGTLMGIYLKNKTSSNIEAIHTLAFCGTKEQIMRLEDIHYMPEYTQSCIYTHGNSKTCIDWLIRQFEASARMALESPEKPNSLQNTAYFLGYALYDNDSADVTSATVKRIIKKLLEVIKYAELQINSLISCILALAWICDARSQMHWHIEQNIIQEIRDTIDNLNHYETKISRAKNIFCKLSEGQTLSPEEEALLLEKIKEDY